MVGPHVTHEIEAGVAGELHRWYPSTGGGPTRPTDSPVALPPEEPAFRRRLFENLAEFLGRKCPVDRIAHLKHSSSK